MTALLSSVLFLALTVVLAVVPVPFVGRAPGSTVNVAGVNSSGAPVVKVEGLPTHPINGELRMTTVSVTRVDSHLGLMEALFDHVVASRAVLPRKLVYPPGKSAAEVKAEEVAMMGDSQSNAVVAALRAAGQPVAELPMVTAVSLSGPAFNQLQPGDLITKVDASAVKTVNDVSEAIGVHRVGEPVVFTVTRAGAHKTVTVRTTGAPQNPDQPVVGIRLGIGYQYTPKVSYGVDPRIVGPSAGVVFSLAIYDLITEDDLLAGRRVAGTGTIQPDGQVGTIGGIVQKIKGAEKAGAEVFLVPAGNCVDVAGLKTSIELVKVETLRDAITGLQKLKKSKDGTGVPRC